MTAPAIAKVDALRIAKSIATNVRRGSDRRVKVWNPSTGETLREVPLDEALVGIANGIDIAFGTRDDLPQTVCAGWEGPCSEGAKPGKRAFESDRIARRNGEPWRCLSCSLRKSKAALTPERRRSAARKANAALTSEQRSEMAREAQAAMTREQRSKLGRAGGRASQATMTPEQRSERASKMFAATRRAKSSPAAK